MPASTQLFPGTSPNRPYIVIFYLFLSLGLIFHAWGRQMKNKICVGMNIIIKNLISSVEEMSRRLKRRVKWDLVLGRVARMASKGGHFSEDLRRQNRGL